MSSLTTFVFTDLVGSVDLKRQMPGNTAEQRDKAYVELVLSPHRELIEESLTEYGGRVVSTAGDGHFLAFNDTVRASQWSIRVQQRHSETPILADSPDKTELSQRKQEGDQPENQPAENQVRVRIGLHVGAPQIDPADPNNYIGRAVDYAARLADHANAGQVLASRSVASLLEDAGLDEVRLHAHGRTSLRGIGEVELHEVIYSGRKPTDPRPPHEDPPKRDWTVLPATMGLTEYVASGSSGSNRSASKGLIPNRPAPNGPAPGGTSASIMTPLMRLGNYELLEQIGSGGMGNVYKARHTLFDRIRAVKVIKPELVAKGGESVVRRFYQEVKATGSLEHPNLVVAIDSSSPEDEHHYLVMEHLEGVSVDEIIAAVGPLPITDACEIVRQAALGLEHLNRGGLVHRDVKPSNLMLTLVDRAEDLSAATATTTKPGKQAVAKLLDLGLALLTENDQGRVTQFDQGGMGTGYYMSPEQWRTTSVDIRADIYSLGCTLHHLLCGHPPFADSDLRPEKAHEREPIPPIIRTDPVPAEVSALIRKMMAKDPADRPQQPIEVARALAPYAERHKLEALLADHLAGIHMRRHPAHETRLALQGPLDTRIKNYNTWTSGGTASKGSTLSPKSRWMATLSALVLALVAASVLAWLVVGQRDRLLESHRKNLESTAKNVATSVSQQIDRRLSTLTDLSKQPKLVAGLEAIDASDDPNDRSLWKPLEDWLLAIKSEKDVNFNSNSYFLTNKIGQQIARAPKNPKNLGRSYAYRDYFHGQLHDLDEELSEIPAPITVPHQSSVYRSSSDRTKLKVAFTVPVYNEAYDEVLGVLGMSVELGHFTALLKADGDMSQNPVEIVMVDTRPDYLGGTFGVDEPKQGLILYHRELQKTENTYRVGDKNLKRLMSKRQMGSKPMLSEYDDLFDRNQNRYWGAYAPVVIDKPGEKVATEWYIVAQEVKP